MSLEPRTAESARKIVEALDKTFFGNSLKYELIVLPPKGGTFLSQLALWVGGGGSAVFAFVNTEVGAAFVEGLTGKRPVDLAKAAGQKVRQIHEQVKKSVADPPSPELIDELRSLPDADENYFSSLLLIEMTRGVLEAENDQLKRVGMSFGALPDALDARAEFYAACIDDREVRRLGFTTDDDFTVPRNAFPERALKPQRVEEKSEEAAWLVGMENIYVNSPSWNEDKHNTRKWQGIDSSRRERLFVIEDAEFWGRIKRKELHFEGLDSLKVEWAYQLEDGKLKHHRVLRVLEFNGTKLADPLTPDAIKAILGSYSTVEALRGGPSLLDFMDD